MQSYKKKSRNPNFFRSFLLFFVHYLSFFTPFLTFFIVKTPFSAFICHLSPHLSPPNNLIISEYNKGDK